MDPDPMQYVEEDAGGKENTDKADAASARGRLNTLVAISVALLATYLLWPHRDTKNLHIALVEAVRANLFRRQQSATGTAAAAG